MPGGRPGAAARDRRAPGRGDRLARVARRAGRRARDGQSANGRQALRPRRPDGDPRARHRRRFACASRSGARPRSRRRTSCPQAGFAGRLARELGFPSARTPGARATASTSRSHAARIPRATSTSSTGGRCRPASRSTSRTSSASPSSTAGSLIVTSEDGRERFDGDPGWSETDLVQAIARWPGGRAWYPRPRGPTWTSASASERSAR